MHIGILLVYFCLNALLALGMHVSTLRSTLERPSGGELIMFSTVFLLAGIPVVIGVMLLSLRRRRPDIAEVQLEGRSAALAPVPPHGVGRFLAQTRDRLE
jgi:hypothetical protein